MKSLKTLVLKNVSAEFVLSIALIAMFMTLGYYSREFALDIQALSFGLTF